MPQQVNKAQNNIERQDDRHTVSGVNPHRKSATLPPEFSEWYEKAIATTERNMGVLTVKTGNQIAFTPTWSIRMASGY